MCVSYLNVISDGGFHIKIQFHKATQSAEDLWVRNQIPAAETQHQASGS